MSEDADAQQGFVTRILHSDRRSGDAYGATHQPIYDSAAFAYADARDLVAVFQGRKQGFAYARQGNPTVDALQRKITRMENGLGTLVFSSGMAAIGSLLTALMQRGDHLVSSRFLFGNTNSLLATFADLGLQVDLVDATDVTNVQAALRENTRLVFVETIANPRTQVADLQAIGELCQSRGLLYVVDNTMTSPWLFQPTTVAASLVINSLTKHIAGHGAVLGGAVTDTGLYDWKQFPNIYAGYKQQPASQWGLQQMRKKGLRDLGASLAPEAAARIALGAETLALRLQKSCANARALVALLDAHPLVRQVYYPGLPTHPQHERAQSLFRDFGALFSFELEAQVDAIQFLNTLQLVISSTNLGDNRTLAIPVASTIYYEMGAELRAQMGIADSLIRISTGIEDEADLLADFQQALASFT